MYSLYHSLLAQHSRQLTSVRCGAHTIAQLHRYLEDVVIDNKLAALLVQSLPPVQKRSARELSRVRELGTIASAAFYILGSEDPLLSLRAEKDESSHISILELGPQSRSNGEFVVIADARFSALIASPAPELHGSEASESEVVWTFEPDVVYSALEYLMARLTAEFPAEAREFSNAVRHSMPKAMSLQLTLSVTTKLAQLLQAQAEREVAVNRIATAIRNSLELDSVLETAATEVGRVLKASSCGIRVHSGSDDLRTTKIYVNGEAESNDLEKDALLKDLDTLGAELAEASSKQVLTAKYDLETILPRALVPLNYQGGLIGMLLIRSNESSRSWTESELLLLHTVADQVTVAVNQAHLFAQLQKQALTDPLTGCYNRRAFEMQLERDLQFAIRMNQPLSLIMLDLDHLKEINDRLGHDGGDNALRTIADCLRAELRGVDTASRYGGDEFAVILPQADLEEALLVAERLRARIEAINVTPIALTASIGVASFPEPASSLETLVLLADRALYEAKRTGRNRVCLADDKPVNSSPFQEQNKECEFTQLVIN